VTPHNDRGVETMATIVGAANVERSRNYLEALDPEFHRHVVEFVYVSPAVTHPAP
jgi:hypothetical protein